MARTELTKTTAAGSNVATLTTLTMAAADAASGNYFAASGKDLLVMHNTASGTAYYVTIDSVADPYGREGDITQVVIPAGAYRILGPLEKTGWANSGTEIHVDAEDAKIYLGVVAL